MSQEKMFFVKYRNLTQVQEPRIGGGHRDFTPFCRHLFFAKKNVKNSFLEERDEISP